MKKKMIKLTETDLKKMIKESVKTILKEEFEDSSVSPDMEDNEEEEENEEDYGKCSPHAVLNFKSDSAWCDKFTNWMANMNDDYDCGYIEANLTNSLWGEFSFESAHYGYSRNGHRRLQSNWDLDYNNACLIKYTIRQSSLADGPSSDYSDFVKQALRNKGFDLLGTTSDDEYGTHLTYWFLKAYDEPMMSGNYSEDEDSDYDEEDGYYSDDYEY